MVPNLSHVSHFLALDHLSMYLSYCLHEYASFKSRPTQLAFFLEIALIIGIIWINFVVPLPLIILEKAIMIRDSLSRPSQTGFPDVEAGIRDIQEDWRKTP